MDRAPISARSSAGRWFFRALGIVAFATAAAAHASSDGLAITGTPAGSAIAERDYSFAPIVTDPSRRNLSFSILNKPYWVTFSASTGEFSGTPPDVLRTYGSICISVTDGVSTVSLPEFSVHVFPPNTADKPKISGTPPTSVTAGDTYVFKPSASDSYGQPLSFSVKNKPDWATFSVATGLLEGSPGSTQTGTYRDIIISASNGELSNSLPAFSISVGSGASSGTASLGWVLPTENTNGSALADLAGVRIYYGTSESDLSHDVEVSNASATSYTLSGLSAGTWYFAVEAYTTTGVASALSDIVSKTIP